MCCMFWPFIIMFWPDWEFDAIMPGGGLACVILGVAIGRFIGVFGILGVPPGWLCWLPLADMPADIGTDIGPWFCTTDDGLGGLPPIAELVCCMGTLPTMGDDMFWGVPWRTTGDETGGWDTFWNRCC